MCGIAGIISNNILRHSQEIIQMCDIISHRGPDGFGYYYGKDFVFGHRRLSIIDLSDMGKQPMKYLDKNVITFNGEIYNYIELKSELVELGYTFNTETDTEVVLAAYDCWGEGCLNRFNGMFAFALYDEIKNVIFCARDRFGVKPFYYTIIDNSFVFASEIKQFTVLSGWKAIANKARVYDFLLAGGMHDHTNMTLFENVFQLRGGECLLYNLSNFDFIITKWYPFFSKIQKTKITFREASIKFKELFIDTVTLRLRSDVKVGSCLSGGLDSSSIVCVMNETLKSSGNDKMQETVSSCFEDSEIDEREFIDEVIDQTSVKSHRIFPTFENLFTNLDKIVWHQDEPFGSTAIYSQWCVYEEAKANGLTVMLDGQGADEHLAGYTSFHQAYFRELFYSFKFIQLHKSLRNYRQKYDKYYSNPYKMYFSETVNRLFPKQIINLLSIIFSKSKKDITKVDAWLRLHEFTDGKLNKLKNSFPNTIKGLSESQLLFTSLPKLLHHQDRNSMAHSIESRAPFVDYRLIEFVFNLPSSFKVNNAITKFILRESLKDVIPSKIASRYDKLGFATPQERWFRENNENIRIELEKSCNLLQKYINKAEVLNLYDSCMLEKQINTSQFWNIICLGTWVRVFSVNL